MVIEDSIRIEHLIISQIITPDARVLDLGCGDGKLLFYLKKEKNAKVQGIELDEAAIYKCVQKGLTVFHSDIDTGLTGYRDQSFEYVILNESLQEIKKVDFIISEALRVGEKVIIGFPNFAHWQARSMLFFRGRSPATESLPYSWHNTPNLRFLSISDFKQFCDDKKVEILQSFYLNSKGLIQSFPNLRALNAIFVISKKSA